MNCLYSVREFNVLLFLYSPVMNWCTIMQSILILTLTLINPNPNCNPNLNPKHDIIHLEMTSDVMMMYCNIVQF